MEKESGTKENVIMGILGGLLSVMPFAQACKEVPQKALSQNIHTTEQEVRSIANSKAQQSASHQVSGMNIESLKAQLIQDEGNRLHVYKDSRGIYHIGIGCNLERKDMPQQLANLGLNYSAVKSGRQDLTPQQVQALFQVDLQKAISDSRSLIPNFDQLPGKAQEVVVNMVFNMGGRKLAGFHNFISALKNHNYRVAAKEMASSDWYHQVGNRSKRLVAIMNSLS